MTAPHYAYSKRSQAYSEGHDWYDETCPGPKDSTHFKNQPCDQLARSATRNH